jgi:glycosyltransferase involved in cell wall biosynthesis
MVESLASGKPVIALARGGAMETVQNGCGLLYDDGGLRDNRDGGSLEKAVASFEEVEHCFRPDLLMSVAANFSEERFTTRFRSVLDRRRISTCV